MEKSEYIKCRNGVDFIPASIQLSAVDAKLWLEPGTEKLLAEILEPLREDYDFILIDTCPSLGALNINTMAAADEVIVTVNPQLLAMMGLQDFLKTVNKIRKRVNDRLEVAGILLTMCDARTILFNPISQSQRFDPKGIFIRHWVPELKHLSDKEIHQPKLLTGLFGTADYPKPIVDLSASRQRALSAFKDLPDIS